MTAFTFTEKDIKIPFRHPLAVENEIDPSLLGIQGTLVVPSKTCSENILKHRQNRVVVLCHGQGGHRNYIYQKLLSQKLAIKHGLYVFRFDFRNNGESQDVDGSNGQTAQSEIIDIAVVAEYLTFTEKLRLAAMVGHSRAVQAIFAWALFEQTKVDGLYVPVIINCSGRIRTGMVLNWMEDNIPNWREKKLFQFPGRRFGKKAMLENTSAEFISIAGYDTDLINYLRPESTVLSIHGNADNIVPVEDAYIYEKIFKERHTLKIIDNADHNYFLVNKTAQTADGRAPNAVNEVVDIITDYLSIENSNARFLKFQGKLPNGQPRFKSIDNVINFRDCGGFATRNKNRGKRQWVKPGILYRSGKLDGLTDGAPLKALGVQQIYDLRSTVELNANEPNGGLFKSPGITTIHAPLFSEKAYSPEALAKRFQSYANNGFEKTYSEILEAGALRWFNDMFSFLRDHPNVPLLFHCSAGKDRTGIFAALVLLLVGVDPDLVCHEYELSTIGYAPEREKILEIAKTGFFEESDLIQYKSISMTGWEVLLSSRYETMSETIQMLERKYGGVEHYLRYAVGLSLEDIETIKKNLLYDGEVVKTNRVFSRI